MRLAAAGGRRNNRNCRKSAPWQPALVTTTCCLVATFCSVDKEWQYNTGKSGLEQERLSASRPRWVVLYPNTFKSKWSLSEVLLKPHLNFYCVVVQLNSKFGKSELLLLGFVCSDKASPTYKCCTYIVQILCLKRIAEDIAGSEDENKIWTRFLGLCCLSPCKPPSCMATVIWATPQNRRIQKREIQFFSLRK